MDTLIDLVNRFQRSSDPDEKLALADQIVVRLSPDLHLFIAPRVPPNLVDDVLQETLIAVALGLDTFQGHTDKQFYGFCYTRCRNKCVDALRKASVIQKHEFSGEELWSAVLESERKEPLTDEEREMLREALDLLAEVRPPCVDYLVAHYVVGMTFEEMGAEFGFPSEDAARMKTHRCLLLARELLGL